MSDDVKHLLAELDGGLDNQADDVSTDDAEVLGEKPNQEGNADSAKAEAREKALNDQASAWAVKLVQEGKTVDDLPEAQAYLKPYIQAKLGKPVTSEKEVKATKPSMSISEQVKYALIVQTLQNAVKEGLLSVDERKKLKERIERESSKGLNPAKALKEALEICGIDLTGLRPKSRPASDVKVGNPVTSKGFEIKSAKEVNDMKPVTLAKYRVDLRANT